MHYVEIFFFWVLVSSDKFVKNGEKLPYLQNYQSKFFFNTVHNLITFSIALTNKNRGGTLCPPPPIITKVYLPLIITKVKKLFDWKLWFPRNGTFDSNRRICPD